jgi:short-subunit dehydrogenase
MNTSPVILITGASSGIGAATARVFGHAGYRVVMAARRVNKLEDLAAEILAAGGTALPIPADITQLDQIENLVTTTLKEYGQIDILLNNAGFGRMNELEQMDPVKDIALQLQVNLFGVIQTTRTVLPHMLGRKTGHIINMASIAGLIAPMRYSIYAASKFGVRGFSDGLRRELKSKGIQVSAIYPGGVKTEFVSHTGLDPNRKFKTPQWLSLTAEDMATTVLNVARRPRRMVVIPRLMWGSVWFNRLFPGIVDWGMRLSQNGK